MRRLLPGAHWEPRYGTHLQAKTYASKLDTRLEGPWEYGTEPASDGVQGRSSMAELKRALDNGVTMKQISNDFFAQYLRHHRALHTYRQLNQPRTTREVSVTVLVGPTGVGKTHRAYSSCGESDVYIKERGQWWDGYEGQTTIIIDEFYGWLPYSQLLRVLDVYPCQVEIKGGYMPLMATTIYVTSNSFVNSWYKYDETRMSLAALRRRITCYEYKASRDAEWEDALMHEPEVYNNAIINEMLH